MGKKLFLLFTLVPLLELSLLILLGDLMGLQATVGLVFITGFAGAYLAKREGLRVLKEWQHSISQAALPSDGIMNGALVLVGGILLITPGVLTDVLGMSLLLPPSRRWIGRKVHLYVQKAIAEGRIQVSGAGISPFGDQSSAYQDHTIIDTEAHSVDEKN